MKKGIKDWWAPQGMFEDLGMKYIGPVDGHDLQAMENALVHGQELRRTRDRPRHDGEGPRLRARPRP